MTVTKKESQSTALQLVEIDQSKFAIEMKDGNMRVNLTKMATPFNKKPYDWLKTNPAKEYLEVMSVANKITTVDLVQIRKGGSPDEQGTWVTDPRIAIRFAQWLSPAFALKVDEVLIGLLLKGSNYQNDDHLPEDRKMVTTGERRRMKGYELTDLIYEAIVISGSQAKLALRLGIGKSTLSRISTSDANIISDEMLTKVEKGCKRIIAGTEETPITNYKNMMNILLKIENTKERMFLYNKLQEGGLL